MIATMILFFRKRVNKKTPMDTVAISHNPLVIQRLRVHV